ncbi:MAG: LysM peptidoglycan-binding domain-containing protein [Gammaproteobacteria bacterium]|nr:LysM peptidoglycan-binding domain-containing protein [Gammaproteobacteria bacterium]
MKTRILSTSIKYIFAALITLGLLAGCASTSVAPVTTGTAEEAQSAISAATSANAKAKELGVEWRDTAKLIASAEEAAAAGDYTKAINLANEARIQAENAIQQAAAVTAAKPVAAESSRLDQLAEGSSDDSYTVARGDSLWAISGKSEIYGNPYQWPIIYKANTDKIADADLIEPGQVLDITRGASSSDVAAAEQHAKTRGAWSVGPVEASDKAYLAQ